MRTVLQCNPWSILRNIQEEANQLFEPQDVKTEVQKTQKNESGFVRDWSSRVEPRVDIKELSDQFVIAADLPGVDPNDIEISIENNLLTLKGEKKGVNLQEGERDRKSTRLNSSHDNDDLVCRLLLE